MGPATYGVFEALDPKQDYQYPGGYPTAAVIYFMAHMVNMGKGTANLSKALKFKNSEFQQRLAAFSTALEDAITLAEKDYKAAKPTLESLKKIAETTKVIRPLDASHSPFHWGYIGLGLGILGVAVVILRGARQSQRRQQYQRGLDNESIKYWAEKYAQSGAKVTTGPRARAATPYHPRKGTTPWPSRPSNKGLTVYR
jgi:hypothetical protein